MIYRINPRFLTGFFIFLLFSSLQIHAFNVPVTGGGFLDIPEAWTTTDQQSWYSPDSRAAAEVLVWMHDGPAGDLQALADAVRPEGAEGDVIGLPVWETQAVLADWTFPMGENIFRGWFLVVAGNTSDQWTVRISAMASADEFDSVQPFLLSVVDSFRPSADWMYFPGAVAAFLELAGGNNPVEVSADFNGTPVSWIQDRVSDMTAQDVIEREALVLSFYAGSPELFYPAWERYYRLIFRDSYSRFNALAAALADGPLPPGSVSGEDAVEAILEWLQSFSYGSTNGFSDLLAPSAACLSAVGDCDSLALALLILAERYDVDGLILISHQASHAMAALDLPSGGIRFTTESGSWVVAELTTSLPLGALPERLDGVTDWVGFFPGGNR